MQFMVFMIPAVYQPKNGQQQPAPDFKPDPVMMERMGKFNDELKKAGGLRSLNGFLPLAAGARLAFAGAKPTVIDGPAIKSAEVVGGYWHIEAKNRQEVVDRFKRCPAQEGDVLEIRQVAESAPETPKASALRRGTTSPMKRVGSKDQD